MHSSFLIFLASRRSLLCGRGHNFSLFQSTRLGAPFEHTPCAMLFIVASRPISLPNEGTGTPFGTRSFLDARYTHPQRTMFVVNGCLKGVQQYIRHGQKKVFPSTVTARSESLRHSGAMAMLPSCCCVTCDVLGFQGRLA